MKKIFILGSSPAGVSAAENIRAKDQESEITIVGFDGVYPYDRCRFPEFIAEDASTDQILFKPKDFYEQNRITVMLDKNISRINLKRKCIFTEEKEQYSYDVLIITDVPSYKFPDIKGTNKSGVYGLNRFSDINKISNLIPLIESVVIEDDSFVGLQLATALVKRKKDVYLLGKTFNNLKEEIRNWIVPLFEEKGLHILMNNTVSEILGDGDAKAVRLASGKVLSSDVIILGNTYADLRILGDSSWAESQSISIDEQFKTNVEDVYALDNVTQSKSYTLRELIEQGKKMAAAFSAEEYAAHGVPNSYSIHLDDLTLDLYGQIQDGEGISEKSLWDKEERIFKQVFIQENRVVGTVLINAQQDKERIIQYIDERRDIQGQESQILGEQPATVGVQEVVRNEEGSSQVLNNEGFENISDQS